MRALLVEDDALIGDGLVQGLSLLGWVVDWLRSAGSAKHALEHDDFDVAILDLGLPDGDGLAVLRGWRQAGNHLPVLILTARDATEARVAGLDAGADDYLVKPFDLDELAARLRALLRRSSGRADTRLTVGAVSIDPGTMEAFVNGGAVALTRHEFVLLERLMRSPGRVVSRDRLALDLYGWDEGVESNSLEVHVHHLRRKLGRDFIRTRRGVGYLVGEE